MRRPTDAADFFWPLVYIYPTEQVDGIACRFAISLRLKQSTHDIGSSAAFEMAAVDARDRVECASSHRGADEGTLKSRRSQVPRLGRVIPQLLADAQIKLTAFPS